MRSTFSIRLVLTFGCALRSVAASSLDSWNPCAHPTSSACPTARKTCRRRSSPRSRWASRSLHGRARRSIRETRAGLRRRGAELPSAPGGPSSSGLICSLRDLGKGRGNSAPFARFAESSCTSAFRRSPNCSSILSSFCSAVSAGVTGHLLARLFSRTRNALFAARSRTRRLGASPPSPSQSWSR